MFNNEIHYRSSAKTVNGIYFPLRLFDYYPTRSTSSPTYNGGHLDLHGIDNYFVLPYVENIDSLMLSFRLRPARGLLRIIHIQGKAAWR